jgi:polysaccharide pyruvyl transferase WcaK-like protein
MDHTPASFLLMPFGNGFPHNDRISNGFIYSNCKFWKKNVLLFDKLSVQETLDIFTAADAAISTRLHSSIFSCIGGIPFINIVHHSKTELFMEYIGKQNWCLDFWHFDYHKAINSIKDFLTNKEFYKNEVNKIKSSSKKLLNQIIMDVNV